MTDYTKAMTSRDYLVEQAGLHRSMRPQDMIKLCYQATFGAEHLLSDRAAAEGLFEREFASATGANPSLYEQIAPGCCRVNLAAWKARGLPPAWLFRMFAGSAMATTGSDGAFRALLAEAGAVIAAGLAPFSRQDWRQALDAYWRDGGGAVHHSEDYRAAEQPAYRLVEAGFIRVFALLEQMAQRSPQSGVCVVALDGRAASGKTTIAAQLSLVTGVGVVHMDDFFLPGALRTQDRLSTPGGNVHYERFLQEVLPEITRPEAFSYRRFDCSRMELGDTRTVYASKWRIVEGAYSCHPLLGDYADIKAFCDVAPQEQLRRITLRNGAEKAHIFAERWIPMEERYFEHFGIAQKADVIL